MNYNFLDSISDPIIKILNDTVCFANDKVYALTGYLKDAVYPVETIFKGYNKEDFYSVESGIECLLKSAAGKLVSVMLVPFNISGEEGRYFLLKKARMRLDSVITNIGYKLISSPPEFLLDEINTSLRIIGDFLDVDRAFIATRTEVGINISFEVIKGRLKPLKGSIWNMNDNWLQWSLRSLEKGHTVFIGDSSIPGGEDKSVKNYMFASGIKSTLLMPLKINGGIIGAIGFSSARKAFFWENYDLSLLNVLPTMYANALRRKETADKLARTESDHTLMMSRLNEAVFRIEKSGKLLYVNRAWQKITGYGEKETLGKNFGSFLYFEDVPQFHSMLLSVYKNERREVSGDFRMETVAGQKLWATIYLTRLINEEKEVIFGTITDINERKLASEALKQNYNFIQTMLDTVPVPVYFKDNEMKFRVCNQALSDLLKISKEEIIGKNIRQLLHEEEARKFEQYTHDLYNEIDTYELEASIKLRDGSKTDVLLYKKLYSDNNGKPHGVVGAMVDISDRKKKGNEIRKLKNAVQNTPMAILLTDANFNIEYVNSHLVKLIGFNSAEEIVNKSILDYIPVKYLSSLIGEIIPSVYTGSVWKREIEIQKIDGTPLPVEMRISTALNEQNEPENLLAIFYDISDRKKAEEALARSQKDLKSIFEKAYDAIILFDPDTEQILEVNKAACELYGFEKEEMLKISMLDLSEDAERGKQKIRETLALGSTTNFETNHYKKDGSLINIETNGRVVNYEGADAILSIQRDITKRKAAEQKVIAALEKEKELNEMKSRFISLVSHEFRTPLSTVLSSAELIQMYSGKWTEEKVSSHCDKIVNSVDELISMLNDVTEISRSDNGAAIFNPEPVNLKEFLRSIIGEVIYNARTYPKIHFNYDSPEEVYNLDKKQLKHIILNLTTNAVKYTPSEKNVRLDVTEENKTLKICVKDEGIGIPEKDQKNLFNPFIRGSNTGTIKGTGLGLSIVKRAADLHKGHITWSSSQNEGSVFTFNLPL